MNMIDFLTAMMGRSEHHFAPYQVAEGTEESRIKRQILLDIRREQACAAASGCNTGRGPACFKSNHAQKSRS